MRYYSQLTQNQRYQIEWLLANGLAQRAIALKLGVHPSTLGRELKRNVQGVRYQAKQAHEQTLLRQRSAAKAVKMTPELIGKIEGMLRLQWSPEQISGRLLLREKIKISHERIYQHVIADKKAGGDLYQHLRHSGKKHKKRYGRGDRRGQIIGRVSIEARPAIVDEKSRLGDWEIDTVIGQHHQQALVTIVERVSKKVLIGKVGSKRAAEVTAKTLEMMTPFQSWVHTITADNGKEFAYHQTISQALDSEFYFARPYHSWERGLNENTNKLIRQYVLKGSSMKSVDDTRVSFIMGRLNNRPRKTLGYSTPNEVFEQRVQRE